MGVLMETVFAAFATMQPGSLTIRVIHSMLRVTDGDLAHHGQEVGFVGIRLGRWFPQSYIL